MPRAATAELSESLRDSARVGKCHRSYGNMEELYRSTICPNVTVRGGQAFDIMCLTSDVNNDVDQWARVF